MKCNLDNKECGDKHELLLHLISDLTRNVADLQEDVKDCNKFMLQTTGALTLIQRVSSASAVVAITIYIIDRLLV